MTRFRSMEYDDDRLTREGVAIPVAWRGRDAAVSARLRGVTLSGRDVDLAALGEWPCGG